jgi:DNA polymerase-3 subunit delta'
LPDKAVFGFRAIEDQPLPIQILTTLLAKGRIPHALLFIGPDGVGKRTAATAFAMAYHCRGRRIPAGDGGRVPAADACGVCPSCRRVAAGSHPDLLRVAPVGDTIRVHQVRELVEALMMKPFEGAGRVVVLAQAQAMNPEAGNALLKALEEPPDRTVLILTARQSSDLLPTIVSRCQRVRFSPLSRPTLERLLREREGLDADAAAVLARMADGSYSHALRLHATDWRKRCGWLIAELTALPQRSSALRLSFAEKLHGLKDQLPEALEMAMSWYRDLAVYPYRPDGVRHRDMIPLIRQAARREDSAANAARVRLIQGTLHDLQRNANPRLALDVLVMRLAAARPAPWTL